MKKKVTIISQGHIISQSHNVFMTTSYIDFIEAKLGILDLLDEEHVDKPRMSNMSIGLCQCESVCYSNLCFNLNAFYGYTFSFSCPKAQMLIGVRSCTASTARRNTSTSHGCPIWRSQSTTSPIR